MAHEITVFASAARTASANSDEQVVPVSRVHVAPVHQIFKGLHLVLDITAASGTSPTLDVKLQRQDPLSEKWVDLPSAAFAQKTGTGTDDLTIYPGIAETANRSVSDVLSGRWRAVATIAGTSPSFTFSLGGTYIP